MYAQFDTQVTLLQRSGNIIPEHEPEIADELHIYLKEEGIEIATGVNVQEVPQKGNSKFVTASNNIIDDFAATV
jgi:pyruvate/2-oxoglutarate dehydrogenase complex dihydrolipoamide dehydrogenase (E3) component